MLDDWKLLKAHTRDAPPELRSIQCEACVNRNSRRSELSPSREQIAPWGAGGADAAPRPKPARLAEIEEELAILCRMTASDAKRRAAVASIVEELQQERAELERVSAGERPDPIRVDLDRLWRIADARVRDLRAGLAAGGESTRAALRALMGQSPLRVAPDPERKFRVDGWLWLPLQE